MQEFLSRVRWDADAVCRDLRAHVAEHLGGRDGVPVLDETGFLKKGREPAGGQRQCSGAAGRRIGNCQVGGFLGRASRSGRAPIDRALHPPESWAEDRARRAGAGIPDEVAFAPKPKLGLAMLERAHAAGVPFAWVTADGVHGADHGVRRWLQERDLGCVLAVTGARRLGFGRVEDLVAGVPLEGWHRLSAGDGAKGPGSTTGPISPAAATRRPGGGRGCRSGAASPPPRTSSPST